MINVGTAIELTLALQLANNFITDEDDIPLASDFSVWEKKQLRGYISGHWKDVVSPTTGLTYRIISFTVDEVYVESEDNLDKNLKIVSDIMARFPVGTIVPVGAWNRDGSQYGTEITPATYSYNEETGESTLLTAEVVTGTAVYPIHDLVLVSMPDDVVYDDDGNELSRTMATDFKQVNKNSGWKDRRWT